ncbi:hypothetical protein V2J94_37900 [Streptomyces sp. DSM 41524]|uniref:Uncharacterized protein n=1 Tax=Streptomyces asiaticus subsp. ignotus TaxID=3098222 RepID=A0ABU7Q870_9ACTN|nr:hypothetical protein [Streptomyces sp. DSM 41524]
MPFIGGETTGSYTRRLANLNGIPDEEFWLMFGTPLRPDGVVGDPLCGDGYLNRAALKRLSVMSHRPIHQLQFALPNLRAYRLLLPVDGGPVWDWPWDTTGCFLVRVCELCARLKGTSLDAYLASDATWQVCAQHGRWLDNRREPGTTAIPLFSLPKIVDAHRLRQRLERRLCAGGRAMFADAYAITSCWWNIPDLNPPVWQAADVRWDAARSALLGLVKQAVQTPAAVSGRLARRP